MLRSAVVLIFTFITIATTSAQIPFQAGDWPQWRGPNRDGVSDEKGLLKEWPKDGPPVVWRVDSVGVGYASLAIKDGRIFTQGDLNGIEHVIALRAKDGSFLWAVKPAGLTKRLETRVTNEWKQADRNGDGQIDETEALARFRWDFNDYDQPQAGDAKQIAAARTELLFRQVDKDQDGRLAETEVSNLFRDQFSRIDRKDEQANAEQLADVRLARLMKAIDANEDGQIDRKEAQNTALDQWFGRIDAREPGTDKGDDKLTSDEVRKYLQQQETGKDGQLTTEELLSFYQDRYPGRDGQLSQEELRGYYGGYRNGQGDGPRGTPTIDGDRVYALGAMGDLSCLDAATGRTIWSMSMTDDLGGRVPSWGYSESPLVVGRLVIVTPGGNQGTLAAIDKTTGEVVWRSTEATEGAHYASAVTADIAGVTQIVQFASQNCFGVDAETGKVLWKYAAANNGTANCCTPIVWQDHVFATSAYGTGGGLAHISGGGGDQLAEEVYFDKQMGVHHGGVVRIGDYIYGLDGGLICKNLLEGKNAWKSRSVSKGSLVAADDMLYLLGENHEVALAEATPDEYREHGRFKIESHGRPSWAHPVVAGGRLYLRDQESLTAYDVRAH